MRSVRAVFTVAGLHLNSQSSVDTCKAVLGRIGTDESCSWATFNFISVSYRNETHRKGPRMMCEPEISVSLIHVLWTIQDEYFRITLVTRQ